MRVRSVRLRQFRSFVDSGEIKLDAINVFVGRNNIGKSSILRALHCIQSGAPGDPGSNIRNGQNSANVELGLDDVGGNSWLGGVAGNGWTFSHSISSRGPNFGVEIGQVLAAPHEHPRAVQQLPSRSPNHFVVPFLSRRKAGTYLDEVKAQYAQEMSSEMSYLAAKVSAVSNAQHPSFPAYSKACEEILGLPIGVVQTETGLRPGIYLPDQSQVTIDQMGDGVPSIVLLLSYLATQRDRLFLVEEPENDLHPSALKALLDLIVESSSSNQFVISTHSNIVVQRLCGAPGARLYRVSAESAARPISAAVELVPPTAAARLEVLTELGYSLTDFDLWDGWLILEESSAERIIRDYLIPWFVPALRSVRTVSAGGVDKVEPLFADFNRLVLFTHMMPVYRDRAWVRVDGDTRGEEILSALRRSYPAWPGERFKSFSAPHFEHYYPKEFAAGVDRVLSLPHGKEKQAEKRRLLNEVLGWIKDDEPRARKALEKSAAPVIADLKQMADELKSNPALP